MLEVVKSQHVFCLFVVGLVAGCVERLCIGLSTPVAPVLLVLVSVQHHLPAMWVSRAR